MYDFSSSSWWFGTRQLGSFKRGEKRHRWPIYPDQVERGLVLSNNNNEIKRFDAIVLEREQSNQLWAGHLSASRCEKKSKKKQCRITLKGWLSDLTSYILPVLHKVAAGRSIFSIRRLRSLLDRSRRPYFSCSQPHLKPLLLYRFSVEGTHFTINTSSLSIDVRTYVDILYFFAHRLLLLVWSSVTLPVSRPKTKSFDLFLQKNFYNFFPKRISIAGYYNNCKCVNELFIVISQLNI